MFVKRSSAIAIPLLFLATSTLLACNTQVNDKYLKTEINKAVTPSNPILKLTDKDFIYAADPAAEVFNGKVYVYVSRDLNNATGFSTMQDYAVLESSDLVNWTNHGVVLKPREYTWASGQMNAPDAAYKNGWYYLYFPYNKTHVGVAKSRTPIGPWQAAVNDKITSIFDPTVFVDDDGQAYIYGNDHKVDLGDPGWHVMGAKLNDNMLELETEWQRLSTIQVNEAVTVFKRNGKYYFLARRGGYTDYFMADTPLPKPDELKYMGHLTEAQTNSPAHTSVIEFNGHWYLFYHRGDVNNGSFFKRSASFEPLQFNSDGSIKLVVFTPKLKHLKTPGTPKLKAPKQR